MLGYEITLPLPPSVNATHVVGKGVYNYKTRKTERVLPRSPEYNDWVQYAGIAWRKQFPCGATKLVGRLRIEPAFFWVHGARGTAASDTDNRIKPLQDFLQGKFFENDNQIDQIRAYKCLIRDGENHVIVRIIEIPDGRFLNPFAEPTSIN